MPRPSFVPRIDPTRTAIVVLLLLFFSAIFWIAGPHLREKTRRPERRLIPAGFEGVLLIVYNEPGYPPLPIEDGFYVHKYPADGIIITSSAQEFGWARDEQFDLLPDGTRALFGSSLNGPPCMLTGGTGGSLQGGAKIDYAYQYVGTKAYWAHRDSREKEKVVNIALQRLSKAAP